MISKVYTNIFGNKTIAQLKTQELYTAQCELLQSQSMLEYYTAMVAFNTQRVKRLEYAPIMPSSTTVHSNPK